MIYFEDYNFAFLHINKTGGTSVKNIFKNHWGEDNWTVIGNIAADGQPKLHEPLDYKMNLLGNKFNDLKVLTTIRNPYARWVSLYYFRQQGYELGELVHNNATARPFKIWLRELFSYPPLAAVPENFSITRFLNNGNLPSNLIILKLEDMTQKLPQLLEKEFNIHIDSVPHENKTKKSSKLFMDHYDKALLQIVYDKDKWLFDKFYTDVVPSNVWRIKLI